MANLTICCVATVPSSNDLISFYSNVKQTKYDVETFEFLIEIVNNLYYYFIR